jgi:hypothetical protein
VEITMTKRLILIILATALLSVGLAAACQLAFADVLPYAAGEDDAMSWQREIAFMIKAAAWVSAEVSGLFAIVLAARLWSKRAPRTP